MVFAIVFSGRLLKRVHLMDYCIDAPVRSIIGRILGKIGRPFVPAETAVGVALLV